jgi:hypothetical protein
LLDGRQDPALSILCWFAVHNYDLHAGQGVHAILEAPRVQDTTRQSRLIGEDFGKKLVQALALAVCRTAACRLKRFRLSLRYNFIYCISLHINTELRIIAYYSHSLAGNSGRLGKLTVTRPVRGKLNPLSWMIKEISF